MINIYKKVEKSEDNLGYIEISKLEKPFLLCISAQDNDDKSIYGTIRQGVQAARVYTSKDIGAGYKVEEFPIDFLGYRYVNSNENDNTLEIVNQYLYPYLTKDGLDKEHLIERARKMNFMTYCDGTKTYSKIEKKLISYLIRDGLNKVDVQNIISNIHLVAIGSRIDMRTLNCTGISIIDVNDLDISNGLTDRVQDIMLNRNTRKVYGKFNEKTGYYYYDGTGEHELSEYFSDNALIKPIIHLIIGKIIEASINNKTITINDLIDEIKKVQKYGTNLELLLKLIDDSIKYNNAHKYSNEELESRIELDRHYCNIGNNIKL